MKLTKIEQLSQDQSITITKGVLRSMGGDKININYSPVMIINGDLQEKDLVPHIEDLLWIVIDALPDPKMTNLRKMAICTCVKKTKTVTAAAKYLKMQRAYISKVKNEYTGEENAPRALPDPND